MRTQEEIRKRFDDTRERDVLGFRAEVLVDYMTLETVRPLLKQDAILSTFENPRAPTRENVLEDMAKYMPFAWEKAMNERGISSTRSVEKMCEWLWLLGDDESLAFAEEDDNYPHYGKPILRRICEKYDFPIPPEATE